MLVMHLQRRQLFATSASLAALSLTSSRTFARDLPNASPKSQGFDPDRLKRIPLALQLRVDAGEAPGFLAAVMRNGKIVQFDSVGYRDIVAKAPMSRDTIFRIMSMTKPIVSVAAMMLVEENKLRLTDRVSRYIPAFASQNIYVSGEGDSMVTAPAKRQIQIRNLLSHTSGYTYGVFGNTPVDKLHVRRRLFPGFYKSLAEFCNAAADMPLMFEPGTQWQYGISTDILGHIVELASGQALPEFLQQRIFNPLGMTDTSFVVPDSKRERFATRYVRKNDKLEVLEDRPSNQYFVPPPAPSGGGGLASTADDYLRFAAMLLNEGELDGARLLGPETVRLMRTNVLSDAITAARDSGFGLGFGVDVRAGMRGQYAGAGTFHWSGANRTHFWVDPTNKIVGLSMTQMDPFDNFFEEDMRALTYQAFLG
jgi:CubicO group peptidase (beta-lactamase class C family)